MENKSDKNGIINKVVNEFHKLSEHRQLNAGDAYLLATYHQVISVEERYKKLISDIDSMIEAKADNGLYSAIVNIPRELVRDYYEKIVKLYESKNYSVTRIQPSDKNNIRETYLVLIWDSNF